LIPDKLTSETTLDVHCRPFVEELVRVAENFDRGAKGAAGFVPSHWCAEHVQVLGGGTDATSRSVREVIRIGDTIIARK